MARFYTSSTIDGRRVVRAIDLPLFEMRIAVKVLIGTLLIASTYYIEDYAPLMVVLILTGLVVLGATSLSTYLIVRRDLDAHKPVEVVNIPVGGVDSEPTRVIPVISGGVTREMVIDVKDDELVKLILKLLDASMKISGGDTSVFPAYRSLNMSYKDYDAALRGLGSLVKRERGTSPYLVHPNTMQSTRQMLATGTFLPYRSDATPSENRLNGA